MVGLVGFLAAHVLYIIANLSVAVWSPLPIVVGVSSSWRRRWSCCATCARRRCRCGSRPSSTAPRSAPWWSARGPRWAALSPGRPSRGRRGALLHLRLEPGPRSLLQEDSPRGLSRARGLLAGADRDRARSARAGPVMAPSSLAQTVLGHDSDRRSARARAAGRSRRRWRAPDSRCCCWRPAPIAARSCVYQVPVFHGLSTEDEAMRWNYFVRTLRRPRAAAADSKYSTAHGGVLYPRAGTLGGCTAHNAMITVYPHNSDWDGIAEATGDKSWRASEMRRYFERLERCDYLLAPGKYPKNFWRKLALFILRGFGAASKANPSRHGFGGWLHTNLADPLLVIHDEELVGIIEAAARAAGTLALFGAKGHPQQAAPDLAVDLARPGRVRAREVAGRSQRLAQRRAQHRGDRAHPAGDAERPAQRHARAHPGGAAGRPPPDRRAGGAGDARSAR